MKNSIIKTTMGLSTIALLTFSNMGLANNDSFKDVQIKSHKLNDTTYMFVGAGGNIGVSAGSDGILIIDDQFAPLAGKISAALEKIQPGAPKFIVNTHYHGDHTGSNEHFGQKGTILAHHNVLKRLAADSKAPKAALPVITYSNNISIHFNQETLEIIHLGPGHTDGDSVVQWKKGNIIHMGDLYFKNNFPYIDLKGGGSVVGYRDNVAKILELINDKTVVIPGHGELATKNELLAFKHMLDFSINWIKSEIGQKLTLAEIQKKGFPEKYKSWSWKFIDDKKWIDTLYQEFSK